MTPVHESSWDLGIDQEVGEAKGHPQNDEHTTDQQAAFGHDSGNVSGQTQIAIDEDLDKKGVERSQCRRFDRGRDASKQRDECDDWKQ